MWLSDRTLDHLRRVADEPDLAGTRYEVLERIGHGGMAYVYRAHDVELDREIALKVLRAPEFDPGLAARMLDEARILARLEHPGIVPVHDVGRLPDGRVYYAMKLVRGQRLDELAAGPVDLDERLRIFQRISEAVAFAHAHGVLHRDLKPENVMVGAFGEVLVMDWGVAKILGSGDDAAAASTSHDGTLHGTRVGTPGYMAPEQELGLVRDIDARTDVYGLGAILEYLLGIRRAPPPATSVNRRLRAICARATSPVPDDRYASVDALAEDVRRFRAGQPVRAYHERWYERAGRFAATYRTAILLVLSYLVVRIVLLVLARR
jgi:eukaryotic-like serine/threonine-protein kinase